MKTEEKKAGHTPGELKLEDRVIKDSTGANFTGIVPSRMTDANLKHFLAVWNGCEGISTEALESGVVGEMREALEEIQNIFSPSQSGWSERTRKALKKVEAALAKAKGATDAE